MRNRTIVLGTSAGGLKALTTLLSLLPVGLPAPVVVAQHRGAEAEPLLVRLLDEAGPLPVVEAEDKMVIAPGTVYLAPAGYHLLVEGPSSFALSLDPPVNYARPSVDVLFESAALIYRECLIAGILTGAGRDGAAGLAIVKEHGGTTVVQDPADAEVQSMPVEALAASTPDARLALQHIPAFLLGQLGLASGGTVDGRWR